jgi:hypothetical protein
LQGSYLGIRKLQAKSTTTGWSAPDASTGLHREPRKLKRAIQMAAECHRIRLGRKPMLTHHQQREAIKRLNAGTETL